MKRKLGFLFFSYGLLLHSANCSFVYDIDYNIIKAAISIWKADIQKSSNSLYAFKTGPITGIELDVPSGLNFSAKYNLYPTFCRHGHVAEEELEECALNPREDMYKCTSRIYRNSERPDAYILKSNACSRVPSDPSLFDFPDIVETTIPDEILDDEFQPLRTRAESTRQLKKLQSHHSFKAFMREHNKEYEDMAEYELRFSIFKENMKKVQFLKETELGTGVYGATKFADLTEEEFKEQHLGFYTPTYNPVDNVYNSDLPDAEIPDVDLPTEFDWRTKGAVTPVKNQGSCGSCWAFSVTGNIEGQYKIQHGNLLSFSEQELVDCDKLDNGCNGGLPENAYKALTKLGGLESEDDYQYDGRDEKCHFDKSKVEVNVTGGVKISTNETEMAQWLLKNGPISIGINANAMQFYMGGVSHPWKFLCSSSGIDHGVLIVGFGIHHYPLFRQDMPFWIVKNSWGTGWGEQGYYRVFRGDGTCGVNQMATSSVIA